MTDVIQTRQRALAMRVGRRYQAQCEPQEDVSGENSHKRERDPYFKEVAVFDRVSGFPQKALCL